jgi:hypothetical protein
MPRGISCATAILNLRKTTDAAKQLIREGQRRKAARVRLIWKTRNWEGTSVHLYICTLFQPVYTYDQLFVLNCKDTWRHPGINRGLESEFILTNERPAHEPHRPIIILPHTATNRPTIHPSIQQLLPIEAPCICICRSQAQLCNK